jgi:hypothetical protein
VQRRTILFWLSHDCAVLHYEIDFAQRFDVVEGAFGHGDDVREQSLRDGEKD